MELRHSVMVPLMDVRLTGFTSTCRPRILLSGSK